MNDAVSGRYALFVVVVFLGLLLSSCGPERGGSVEDSREAVAFRWDFSEEGAEQVLLFELSSEASIGTDEEPSFDPPEQMGEATATLVIASKGDGTADVIMRDKKLIDRASKQEVQMPDSVFAGMRADGTGPVTGSSEDAMSRILFLLPDRELAPGESTTREISVPVRENGRQSYLPVDAEITLVGYDEDGAGEVARFEVRGNQDTHKPARDIQFYC